MSHSPISPTNTSSNVSPSAAGIVSEIGGSSTEEKDVEEQKRIYSEDLYSERGDCVFYGSGGETSCEFPIDEGDFGLARNTKDNHDVVSEMNKMYRKSPFMQRRKEIGEFGSPRRESMLSNLGMQEFQSQNL